MPVAMSDLFCESCASYVHAFLDRCPACGAVHPSRFEDARQDPASGALRQADPAMQQAAAEARKGQIVMAFRRGGILAMGGLRGGDDEELDVEAILNRVAGALTYRTYGAPPRPDAPIEASMSVAPDGVRLTDARRRAVVLAVPPSRILSIQAGAGRKAGSPGWAGIEFGVTRIGAPPAIPYGDLLVAYAGGTGILYLSIGNRPGLLATKARSGHYEELGRWMGVLAGAAAAERWSEIGPAAHAAELGLGSAGFDATGPALAAPAAGSATVPAGAREGTGLVRPTVRESLEELESLRRDDLITGDEYRQKKDEILRRL